MRVRRVAVALAAVLAVAAVLFAVRPPFVARVMQRMQGMKTVEERLAQYGPDARKRLKPFFQRSGVTYPPAGVVLVGLKQERELQLYAKSNGTGYRLIRSYPILAASGKLGPKLQESDRQVPEGIYKVVFLNPNSLYHLSLRLDYPNEFDRKMAERDGRTELGGDIMIHGARCSVGCLAMGDPASEELFVMAADTGARNIRVVLSPIDFRAARASVDTADAPEWTERLYETIRHDMRKLPRPTNCRPDKTIQD